MTSTRLAFYGLLVLPLAACDAQGDGDYAGEPLITMTGTVQNPSEIALPEGVDLVLAYFLIPDNPEQASFCILDAKAAYEAGEATDLGCPFGNLAPDRLAVKGEFPSTFLFELLHPPPASVIVQPDQGPPTAVASIYAVRKGSADDGELLLGDLVGYSPHWLTYFGTEATDPTGKVWSAGFHVFRSLCGGMTVPSGTECSVPADGERITVEIADLPTLVKMSTFDVTGA
jgi:hypothetical protein